MSDQKRAQGIWDWISDSTNESGTEKRIFINNKSKLECLNVVDQNIQCLENTASDSGLTQANTENQTDKNILGYRDINHTKMDS